MFQVVSIKGWRGVALMIACAWLGICPVGAEEHAQSIGGTLANTTLSGYVDTSASAIVPEPSSLGLFAAALVAAGFLIHRRRS